MTDLRNIPKQARSTARLKGILDAARTLYNDPSIGRDRLTTTDVADIAGCSIGTVYRYFPDRFAILDAIAPDRDQSPITPQQDEQEQEKAALTTTLTLRAMINPAAAGSVQFRDGATVIGTVAATAGEAVFTISSLALGAHSLSARFVPADAAAFGVSTSQTLDHTIDPAPLASIITTNLLADVDAATVTVATGAKVTTITPSAGAELAPITQATTSLQPTFVASDINGKPAIKFVPTQRLGPVDWSSVRAIPNTVFMVFRSVSLTTSGNSVITGGNTSVGAEILREAAGVWQVIHGVNSPNTLPVQPPVTTDVQVFCVVFEGATTSVYLNSKAAPQTVVAGSGGTAGGLGSKTLGGFAGGSSGGEKNIMRDISYAGRMGESDIRRMLDLLANQYGATLT